MAHPATPAEHIIKLVLPYKATKLINSTNLYVKSKQASFTQTQACAHLVGGSRGSGPLPFFDKVQIVPSNS